MPYERHPNDILDGTLYDILKDSLATTLNKLVDGIRETRLYRILEDLQYGILDDIRDDLLLDL